MGITFSYVLRAQYDVEVARTKEKITELLKAGFEWVGQDNDGLTHSEKKATNKDVNFEKYLDFADFATQFFDNFFGFCGVNLQGEQLSGGSKLQLHHSF